MGWEKGRYFTRSYRVGGKVIREYVGNGFFAEIEAAMDANAREERKGGSPTPC